LYPPPASSGLDIFTPLDELLSVPYGVRSIKNGNGSPALSEPTGRRITTCSFTPSRIGTIASLRVYSFDTALRGASCAPAATTENRKQTESITRHERKTFMKTHLDAKSKSANFNFLESTS